MTWDRLVDFGDLMGETLTSVDLAVGNDAVELTTTRGHVYMLSHEQDCCESVCVEEVVGDCADLIGHPLLKADEVCEGDDEQLWTFYHLRTVKGSVTIRWLGESNGYYSVSVSCTRWESKQ